VAKKKATRSPAKKSAAETDVSFEESLGSLETIVAKLESGELGLGDALEAYEQGIGQLKACHRLLEAAERRIEILSGVDAEGNPVLQSFPPGQGDEAGGRGEAADDGGSNSEELF
jgi:exodeoxyribonuclease VII small subunit